MRLKIRIDLASVDHPKVWREMWIPMEINFDTLHTILQIGMGWKDEHLYSFQESLESRYFHIMRPPYEELPAIDSTKVVVKDILWGYFGSFQMAEGMRNNNTIDRLHYIYDFGDHWEHEISVTDFDSTPVSHAEIIDGGGACPPEDCGGVPGYKRLKDYLNGKMNKKEYYDWFTAVDAEGFDVHRFDMVEHNRILRTLR
ncbi:MAG: plasmid pRiA4b ORF-3 family protein [Saprospiraceae bacterium]|jgi:hypothetical protein|nr:plasmid pRiA4b ORF-3 family protein [Saprospiraceae bacterium]